MDLSSPLLSVICLLGAVRCSTGDEISCPCPEIPLTHLTEPPPRTCFQIEDKFRYTCIAGYLRKAGTSNLTRCKQISGVIQWTSLSLQCIPDPTRTTTQPPKTTVRKGLTDIPHDSTIATTVTAASTNLQMTQSRSISASVTAETDSAEPTPPGLQVPSDHSQGIWRETKATDGTTSASTTTEASNNNNNLRVSKPDSTTTAVITIPSLLVICALIGLSFFCYRRRSEINMAQHTREEGMPMNLGPVATAS